MKRDITILAAILFVSYFSLSCFAACSPADLTGDCKVNFADFAIMAADWLDEGIPDPAGMAWVSIGGGGYEGFTGEMSKYETTNSQYCHYLNAAKASGDITVSSGNGWVVGISGPYSGENYYNLGGTGYSYNGATNGGASRIFWTGSSFRVDVGFENHPVTYVNWYGAMAFCNYYGWRLPTEWEWQAVADYDGSYSYGHGPETINTSFANYYGSFHPFGTTVVGAYGSIHGYGMCDMAGNVFEWTTNYNDYLGYRVYRGGAWSLQASYCTVSYSAQYAPQDTSSVMGFRVCR